MPVGRTDCEVESALEVRAQGPTGSSRLVFRPCKDLSEAIITLGKAPRIACTRNHAAPVPTLLIPKCDVPVLSQPQPPALCQRQAPALSTSCPGCRCLVYGPAPTLLDPWAGTAPSTTSLSSMPLAGEICPMFHPSTHHTSITSFLRWLNT